jgi:hypothetical protein
MNRVRPIPPPTPLAACPGSLPPPNCQEVACEYLETAVREIVPSLQAMVKDPCLEAECRLEAADMALTALELYGAYAEATQATRMVLLPLGESPLINDPGPPRKQKRK